MDNSFALYKYITRAIDVSELTTANPPTDEARIGGRFIEAQGDVI
jgi:hypothetical protein